MENEAESASGISEICAIRILTRKLKEGSLISSKGGQGS